MNKPCLQRVLIAGSMLLVPLLPGPTSPGAGAALRHHETSGRSAHIHRAAYHHRWHASHRAVAAHAVVLPANYAPLAPAPIPSNLPMAKVLPEEPEYVSMDEVKDLQKQDANAPLPVLQPVWEGHALQHPMRDLLTDPAMDNGPISPEPPAPGNHAILLAQAFPQPLPPAPVPSSGVSPAATPVVPHWVRYPLEFQLCGIALGTKAVDKDQFNRIDRYGLFALHGNPTAVVVPTGEAGGGGITINQQPLEVAALFPASQGGGLPDWASAITVTLDNNHVEWLYRRDTYSMGFVVDRLGFVDAIVVAGISSNIAKTQLEDPLHSIKLGDDLRKVLFRYGYPDTLETYNITAVASTGIATETAAPAAGAAQAGAPPGAPGQGAPGQAAPGAPDSGAGAVQATGGNSAFRTFEVRYEQSYNVVFTIRDNRVVRIYIFGDPDFFNARRRDLLRNQY